MAMFEKAKNDIYPFISPLGELKDSMKGKMVIVTGSGSGIGRAIAQQYALAGASTVILSSRRAAPLEESKASILAQCPSCKILTIPTDISSERSVQALFDQLPGVPDVLVNNAATSLSWKRISESVVDDWWGDMENNVKGTYLCTRAFLRLLDGKPGVILNVTSAAATGAVGPLSGYGISKTGVVRFTEYVDAEYSKQGVQCIAFHPGGVAGTDLAPDKPDWVGQYLKDTPELAGGTALYLSTPRAVFLRGRTVYSSWDMELLEKSKERIVQEDLLKMNLRIGGPVGPGTTITVPRS